MRVSSTTDNRTRRGFPYVEGMVRQEVKRTQQLGCKFHIRYRILVSSGVSEDYTGLFHVHVNTLL